MTNKELLKIMEYSDSILDIINKRDQFTQSDLQAAVDAVVHKIIKETKEQYV